MGSKKGVCRGKYSTRILQQIGPISCWKCNKIYKRRPVLFHHILTKHLNYSVSCPVCDLRFISLSTCHRHLKNVHQIFNYKTLKLELKSNPQNRDNRDTSAEVDTVKRTEILPNLLGYVAPLSFSRNKAFGKHVVAESSIDVGQTVLATPPFASIEYLTSIGSGCFHCGKQRTPRTGNFIECSHCISVQFCSKRCSLTKLHKSKCNTVFNRNDCSIVRLSTELILVALNSVANIEIMLEFCRGILFSGKKSDDCLPPFLNYGEILQLKGEAKKKHFLIAKQVRNYVMLSLKSKLRRSAENQRIIYHMAARHAVCLEQNTFSEEFVVSKGGICTHYSIYDAISRMNHSCAPNIHHYIDDKNILNCVAVRPMKRGDQIFMNYLNGFNLESTISRQSYIKEIWNFDCKCDKCSLDSHVGNDTDLSYQYIKRHFMSPSRRSRRLQRDVDHLREQCVKYIQEFGQSWSTSLDFVVCCLISIINDF